MALQKKLTVLDKLARRGTKAQSRTRKQVTFKGDEDHNSGRSQNEVSDSENQKNWI